MKEPRGTPILRGPFLKHVHVDANSNTILGEEVTKLRKVSGCKG